MNKWWLQVAVGVALVGLLMWRARVWELGDTLADFNPLVALLVVLLNLPAIALLAVRTHFVLRRLGYDASPLALAPISAVGNVAAVVTPGATGDVIRAPFLKGHHAVSYSDSFATIIYERSFSFCILCLSTALVAIWNVAPIAARIAIPVIGLGILAVPAVAAVPLVTLSAWAGNRPSKDPWALRPLVHALNVGEGRWVQALAKLMKDPRLSLTFAVLTIAIFATMVCQVWLIADSLSVRLSAGEASLSLGASVAAGIASFLPLGLGALDWTLTALLESAGATFGSATAVAILYRVTNSLPAGLLGVASYAFLVIRLGRAPGESPPEGGVTASPGDSP
ncbi:MAG TPA: lysylphosphatidylglycerol synthase transmembrane domain-containing protein [Dehalococcoidia bacterium]|nr:lysylphosphatidylglycerol synthase transmembrane domain-containing protein [Dehalococcoidia bacterium]